MHVLVTGSNGFIGQNLIVHLNELETYNVLTFSRENSIDELRPYKKIGIIFSLIFVLLILYKLIIFIIRLYQKYNLPKIKNDNINSHIFF